jgi:hypothetical protein
MCGCTGNGNFAFSDIRATILRNPVVVIGPNLSVTNAYRLSGCSRFSLRSARISPPPIGCTLGVPFLIRRTCSIPLLRSICSQRSEHNSAARNPWRYATRSMVASRWPYRPRSRAVSISRSTSLTVRYSLPALAVWRQRRGYCPVYSCRPPASAGGFSSRFPWCRTHNCPVSGSKRDSRSIPFPSSAADAKRWTTALSGIGRVQFKCRGVANSEIKGGRFITECDTTSICYTGPLERRSFHQIAFRSVGRGLASTLHSFPAPAFSTAFAKG